MNCSARNHSHCRPGQGLRWLLAILVLLCAALLWRPAGAVVVYRGSASGINTGLPTNGTPGALTIARPAAAKPGMVMIVSIAARPSGMSWSAPAGGGWTQLSVTSEQPNGGVSTAPGGMTLRTYYRIVGITEPTSYTWTFANPSNTGGTAVAGMLVFSGIDTASNPINGTPTSLLSTTNTTVFQTTPVTTTVPNTMMISVLSVLSADSFGTPMFVTPLSAACTASGASAITDVLDVRSPTAANATGTTVDMAYFTQTNAGTSCATRATITTSGSSDYGVGHLMALRPSLRDLSLDMVRSVPLSAGGTASYTLTVENEGSLQEPGPLAIVDTLPAGLTYAGFTGAGWACSATGQVVTCTRTGALAAGASATPLVLNVSVAAGVSGVFTNSAIVSGTGGDGNSSNDTATDSYAILPTPYAYYALDEAGNVSTFANTASTTSVAATALGSTRTVGNPPSIGQAIAGSPGTCGAASNPVAAGSGINTAIDVNAIGANAGSIAFWYSSNTAWNDGNARMLFDASADISTGDRHFFLAKDTAGRLVFSLRDSGGTVATATSASYAFGANSWHHIGVSWDMAADRFYIYLDGDIVAIASATTNVNGVLGALNTLYVGAQRSANVTGAPAAYTANGANGYFDEIRIYARALDPLEYASVADLVHACAGTVDHYELIVPATASACVPLPAIQVYACAGGATASACSGNLQAAVNGKTVGLTASAGTLGSTAPVFDAIGQANTTLNYPTGGTSTITLAVGGTASPAPNALNATRCCRPGSSCVTANSCSTAITVCSIAASGFAIVDSHYAANSYDTASDHRIYTKLAGFNETTGGTSTAASTFKLDVVALKSTGGTETGYVGAGSSKTVKLDLIDDSGGVACNSTGAACAACAKLVVATVNPVTFAPGDGGYQNDVTVAIGNSNAYPRLIARVTDSNGASPVLACSSDAFALRPSAVLLTTNASAASPLATAAPAVKAGDAFSLEARTAYGGNYKGTLTLDTGKLSAQKPSEALAATGGAVGAFTPLTLAANPATAPSGNATYGEVGYLYLAPGAYHDKTYTAVDQGVLPDPGDCIKDSFSTTKSGGRYGCWIGTGTEVSLGRFIPHHFVTTLVPASGSFTYSGQPFASVTVTAVNAAGLPTTNYAGLFARGVTLSDSNDTGTAGGNNSAALGDLKVGGGSPIVPAATFINGVATLDGTGATPTVSYSFTNRLSGPLGAPAATLPLKLHAQSSGDVVTSTGYETGAVSPILSGRARIDNVYGSAQLPLSLVATAQYYNGSTWVTNTQDTGATGTHLLGPPVVSGAGFTPSATCAGVACTSASGFTAGLLEVRLAAPGVPGYVDLLLDLPSWLSYPWKSATSADPQGRATFGIYKTQNRIIYRRERY